MLLAKIFPLQLPSTAFNPIFSELHLLINRVESVPARIILELLITLIQFILSFKQIPEKLLYLRAQLHHKWRFFLSSLPL
jgi:hypothetical protein